MKSKRSLYQCFNAKVKVLPGDVLMRREDETVIMCAKGHRFPNSPFSKDLGAISIDRLIRGAALEFTVCQSCKDYDEMGPPVPKEERGWKDLLPVTEKQ